MAIIKKLSRDDGTWEQVVMGEVLMPDRPNSYGDIYTEDAIREFCYEFARQGYGMDVNHSQIDINGIGCYVVESFIARPGDPDFIVGSWVVATKILDESLWQKVLDGDIAGYSFEALCTIFPVTIQNYRNRQVVGVTEPDPWDGHTHDYLLILDHENKPITVYTGITDGHSHKIRVHTVTDAAETSAGRRHLHRYQIHVSDDEGEPE